MNKYRVTFERIGRTHDIPEQIIEAADGEELVEKVHRFAGRHLGSREWDVLLFEDHDSVTRGEISVGAGSYGKGRWELVA